VRLRTAGRLDWRFVYIDDLPSDPVALSVRLARDSTRREGGIEIGERLRRRQPTKGSLVIGHGLKPKPSASDSILEWN
jgi:hypothetical protein